MVHSEQLRPIIEEEDVLMEEDLDKEERLSSLDQNNTIEDEPMDDSGSDSDMEEDETKISIKKNRT